MVLNRNNRKEISAIEDLVKAKVFVNPGRFEELLQLKEELWRPEAVLPETPCTLLCLNVSQTTEDALRKLSGFELQVEPISTDPANKEDRKRFVKLFAGKQLQRGCVSAIVHELSSEDEELAVFDRRVIALSLLNKLPVICVATAVPDALPAASAATGHTWPVFFIPHPEDARPLCAWLAEQLPRVRALAAAIESDLQARVAPFARVNAPLHFLSRASVALVPFGVMTVNFLGIVRLMANILQVVGMRGDTSANKALSMLGAQNAALVTAVDSLGDVYSFAIMTTVLADLNGMGLVAAAEAMDVVDGLMLGSISVVTGAVSAIGAYLSRPLVVTSAAEFLASLQLMYVLNPTMRREGERRGGGKGRGRRGGRRARRGDPEAQGLLQRSGAMSGAAGEAGGAAAAEAAAGAAAAAAPKGAGKGKRREAAEVEEAGPALGSGVSSEAEESGSGSGAEEVQGGAEGPSETGQAGAAVAVGGGPGVGVKEAKAAARAEAKAAKVAAKAEKAAVRAGEKERGREAKQVERERRAGEKQAARERLAEEKEAARQAKAAAKEAKARGAAPLPPAEMEAGKGGAVEAGLQDGARLARAASAACGDSKPATAAGPKVRWWHRKQSAPAGVLGATDAGASSGAGDDGGNDSSSSSSEGGEEDAQDALGAAVARDERMGLDEQTRRGLMEFLSRPDAEVYDGGGGGEESAAAAEAAPAGMGTSV